MQADIAAETVVARSAALEFARHYEADFDGVWSGICRVSENMLILLDSPEGWSALGAFVTRSAKPALLPTVH